MVLEALLAVVAVAHLEVVDEVVAEAHEEARLAVLVSKLCTPF